ncbi:MAG: hypothetical protein A2505_09615 [Deltaproteobacteria bacterium RIFOXYD12_FULL_55_16]|nr:MAG: hypothetical protein A2505_09615 [Deltaproteobacteria bacterium RIFOXYD12_FULL_55_16]
MKKRAIERRSRRPVMVGAVILLLLVFAGVVIRNQFFDGNGQLEQGDGQKEEQARAVRGGGRKNIYDRNFMELAVSFQRSSLYARPLELDSPEKTAREVALILGVEEKNILSALKGERSFAWLGRDLSREKAVKIADLNLKGVYRINQVQRFYPGNQLGAHVLGFIKDEQGLAGVEFYYDSVLRGGGAHNTRLAEAGASRKKVEGSDSASLVLTLDIHLQNILEQKLKGLVESTGAKAGVAVLMTPDTGEILGLASLPDYDPNRFWEFSDEARRNRAIESTLDLGAMERLFQTAIEMEKSLVLGSRGAEGEAGLLPVPAPEAIPKTAWNLTTEGRYVSPEGVGFAQIVARRDELNAFADKIGLTVKGEVDLPEALFVLKEENAPGPPDKLAAVIKAGNPPGPPKAMPPSPDQDSVLKATPLALLSAFCRLINGGQVMTPHVLRAVWQNEQVRAVPVRQRIVEFALRPEVSAGLRQEMKKVTGAGRGNFIMESLRVQDLVPAGQMKKEVAGKAQAAKEGGEKATPVQPGMESILLGMAPLEHPEVALVVVLDGARIDSQANSPIRIFGEEMLAQGGTALRKTARPPTALDLAVREIVYHKKMEQLQGKSSLPAALAQGAQELVMPEVLGMSGRKAMQTLQPYGLRLQLAGSGRVASQSPQAGAALKGVEKGVLHLKTM